MTDRADAVANPYVSRASHRKRHRRSSRAVTAAVVGNILEWFDFGTYAFLATVIAESDVPDRRRLRRDARHLRRVRSRLRGASARRDHLRLARRQERPQVDAHLRHAADGRRHALHGAAADVCVHRHHGADPAGRGAHAAGHFRRRRTGQRGRVSRRMGAARTSAASTAASSNAARSAACCSARARPR